MKFIKLILGIAVMTAMLMLSSAPAPAQIAQGTYGYYGAGNAPSTLVVNTGTNFSGAIDCRGYRFTGLTLKFALMSASTTNTVTAVFAQSYDGTTADTNKLISLQQGSSGTGMVQVTTNVDTTCYGWIIPLAMTNAVSGTAGPTATNISVLAFQKPGF